MVHILMLQVAPHASPAAQFVSVCAGPAKSSKKSTPEREQGWATERLQQEISGKAAVKAEVEQPADRHGHNDAGLETEATEAVETHGAAMIGESASLEDKLACCPEYGLGGRVINLAEAEVAIATEVAAAVKIQKVQRGKMARLRVSTIKAGAATAAVKAATKKAETRALDLPPHTAGTSDRELSTWELEQLEMAGAYWTAKIGNECHEDGDAYDVVFPVEISIANAPPKAKVRCIT